jgi:hypothetical protein
MAEWTMTGLYFKSCNCEAGCPCDFMSPPSYHHCEGVLGMKVESGTFDDVSLDGVKWAVAYHWPGPLHEGNGTVKPYFDPSTSPEQLGALGQILTGQVGGKWWEVIASIVTTVKDPVIAPIDFEISGKSVSIKIGDVIENRFAPMKNPVTGEDFSAQISIPGSMEYSDKGMAEVVVTETMRSTDEIAFDHSGTHTSLVEQQTFGSHR